MQVSNSRQLARLCAHLFFLIIFSFPLIGVSSSAVALETGSANEEKSASLQGPEKFIDDLGQNIISILSDKNVSQEKRDSHYHQILKDAFDLNEIGRFALGRHWKDATQEQRQEYLNLFEQLVVKMYGTRLNFYSGESFRINGSHKEGGASTIVNSEVVHPGGKPPTVVDWRVQEKEGKLHIIDVVIEGVSQSVTQRQEYSAIIARNNGMIDGLLKEMRAKLSQ